jgi:hypothetical protein
MGYQGSNYDAGSPSPESGTLAGPGSYVALNADGEMVLVQSTAGGGTGNSTTRVFSGSAVLVTAGITSSQEILASGNIRTELGDLSGSGLIVSKNVQAQYGTISGSQGIFTKDVQMASDLYVSGSVTVAGAGVGNSTTRVFSGSRVIATLGITSSAEILASGNIRTNLGTLSGTTVVASGDIKTQYGVFSGSKAIFTGDVNSMAGNLRLSGTAFLGHGQGVAAMAPANKLHHNVTGALWVTSSHCSKFSGSLSSSNEIFGYSLRTSGDVSVTGTVTSGDLRTGDLSSSARIFGFGLETSGDLGVTGSIKNASFISSSNEIFGYSLRTSGDVNVTGTVTSADLRTGDLSSSARIFGFGLETSGDLGVTGSIKNGSFISSSNEVFGYSLRTSGDVNATGSLLTELGTISGSKLVITDDFQSAVDIKTSGSVLAELGTFSGSGGIFTNEIQCADDIKVTGSIVAKDSVLLGTGVTTNSVLALTADDTLTSGQAISIDHNDAATTGETPAGIRIDFDKDGNVGAASGVGVYVAQGVSVNMADAGTNNAASVVFKKGFSSEITTTNAQGSTVNIGYDVSGSGGAANFGLRSCIDDTSTTSADIMMSSSINVNDYGSISVGQHGVMTIQTVDESAALANIEIEADGDIEIETAAAGQVEIQTHTATGPGTGANTANAVTALVAKVNGITETTLFVDITGWRGFSGNNNVGRIIGRDGQSSAYLTKLTTAVNGLVYAAEVACVEVPTETGGGSAANDIDLRLDTSDAAQGADGSGFLLAVECDGAWAVGKYKDQGPTTITSGGNNYYVYLANGSAAGGDNDYNAGKLMIKFYGTTITGQD